MKIKAFLILSLVLLFCVPVQGQALFGNIKSVKDLPINGVKMIESDKGVFFVSENGRFAWKAPILDMWNRKEIMTPDDIEAVVQHIDLKKLGIDPAQMSSLKIGKGKHEEVIFASSDCPHCIDLLKQAIKLDLNEKYKFWVVLLPMGEKSKEHTKKLLCAADQEAAVKALVSGNYEGLESTSCEKLDSFKHTAVVARILGLRSVPYLIRHDGKEHAGEMKNLAAWLEGNDQPKNDKTKTKEAKKQ